MEAEPRVAYMTDDFGLSPAFPSILASLGIEYTAGSRVDGHYFPGADYSGPGNYPLPGSTAELLLRELQTTDIVWRADDGSEVIFHLNPKTYDQGGLIALRGIARWMDIPIGVPDRSERNVARRIESYVRDLSPYSKTPYMFCPIGTDFGSPITGLRGLLDRYNLKRYPDSGVYAALASLEDYMDLVAWYRGELPVVALDPNPNFMGFYFSRPGLKEGCRSLVSGLLTAEKMLFLSGTDGGKRPAIENKLAGAWEVAVVSNHHDFVTGTSPDRVYEKEQEPWVREANRLVDRAIEQTVASFPALADRTAGTEKTSAPAWSLDGGVLRVESPCYQVELDAGCGGCVTSLVDRRNGAQALSGYGNDLVLYEDSGGLWRMGCEFKGGRFGELARASWSRASVRAAEKDGVLQVTINSSLGPLRMTRLMWFAAEYPLIWMRTMGSLSDYRAATCSFATAFSPRVISMDVAGGVVDRPLVKTYDPTFWSAQSFVHYRDRRNGSGLALFTAVPATVSGRPAGEIEWLVARNARRERAFGFLPLLAHPAAGADPSIQVFDSAVCLTVSGDWRDNGLHLLAAAAVRPPWRGGWRAVVEELADGAVTVDSTDVRVLSVKTASVGDGSIARLFSFAGEPVTVRLEAAPGVIEKAFLCDAMERDLRPVEIEQGKAVVPLTGNITSVRLFL
jgi:hypothetical protein